MEGIAKDLTGDDRTLRIVATQHIGKFVLEPAQALIKYIAEGDCIQTLTVSNTFFFNIIENNSLIRCL